MRKILISACLLGEKVRYNGTAIDCLSEILNNWINQARLVPFCPEVAAGMTIPRAPAEIVPGNDFDFLQRESSVLNNAGENVSEYFLKGAKTALDLCIKNNIDIAILTESSPSCGSTTIYDGTFSGVKITGEGVTTALLRQKGILVFNQFSIEDAERALKKLT